MKNPIPAPSRRTHECCDLLPAAAAQWTTWIAYLNASNAAFLPLVIALPFTPIIQNFSFLFCFFSPSFSI